MDDLPQSQRPPWGNAVMGLNLVCAALLAQALVSALLSGLGTYTTVLIHAGESSKFASRADSFFIVLGVLSCLVSVVTLVGLALTARDPNSRPAAGLLTAAVTLVAVDLAVSIFWEVAPRISHDLPELFWSISRVVSLGTGLASSALVLEAALRLRREADGPSGLSDLAARALFWTGSVLGLGVHLARNELSGQLSLDQWSLLALRMVVLLVVTLVTFTVARGAILGMYRREPRAAGPGPGAP